MKVLDIIRRYPYIRHNLESNYIDIYKDVESTIFEDKYIYKNKYDYKVIQNIKPYVVNLYWYSKDRLLEILKGGSRRRSGLDIESVQTLFELGLRGKAKNLHSTGDKLVSYRSPIFIRKQGDVIMNSEVYSTTTERHKNYVYCDCALNFEYIRSRYYGIDHLEIIDRNNYNEVLFKIWDKYVFKTVDNNREYYIDFSYNAVNSILKAKRRILPNTMKYRSDIIGFKRQGEFFLVVNRKDIKPKRSEILKNKDIPIELMEYLNNHYATRYFIKDGRVYVNGTFRHRNRDHKMMRINDRWYELHKSEYRGETPSYIVD